MTPIKKPTSKAELQILAERAARLMRTIEADTAKYQYDAERMRRESLNRLNMIQDPANRKAVESVFADELKSALKKLRDDTASTRMPPIQEIHAINEAVQETREHLADPILQGTIHSMGSERRYRVGQELLNAGPASVRSFAAQAELTGDKEAAAAILMKLSATEKKYRLVDATEFATKIFGQECENVLALAKNVRLGNDRAIAAMRAVDGNPLSPLEKVKAGLDHEGNRISPVEVPSPKSNTKTALEKISDGLAEVE